MYVCNVCMYVCMYVCMFACMQKVCKKVCLYIYIYAYICVYKYIYIYLSKQLENHTLGPQPKWPCCQPMALRQTCMARKWTGRMIPGRLTSHPHPDLRFLCAGGLGHLFPKVCFRAFGFWLFVFCSTSMP